MVLVRGEALCKGKHVLCYRKRYCDRNLVFEDTRQHTIGQTHIHIDTHTYTHIQTDTHKHIHTYTDTHIYTHTYKHTHTHTRTDTHTHTDTDTHAHRHTRTQVHTHTHTDTHRYTHHFCKEHLGSRNESACPLYNHKQDLGSVLRPCTVRFVPLASRLLFLSF